MDFDKHSPEEEKRRQKEKRDFERAENIREAVAFGEEVDSKDVKWLERYDAKIAAIGLRIFFHICYTILYFF